MIQVSGATTSRIPASLLFPAANERGITANMNRPTASSGTAQELVELLGAVAGGDRSALAAVYARTSAKLYGICLRLMESDADAQDVLHDAYLTVWRKADRFDPSKASPITWLAVITRNKAIDRLRQRRAPADPDSAAAEIPDDGPSALDVIVGDQERERLARCLGQLDERARKMIRSAFFRGVTYAELAAEEDVPLGTMKSWIRRGLISLRGCLEQ